MQNLRLGAVVLATGALAACGGGRGGTKPLGDAPVSTETCQMQRDDRLDRTCTVDADCRAVASADCCGPIEIAVRAGTQDGFPAVEQQFETCLACPPLGCAHQDEAEDGTPVGSGTIVARCATGRCTTVVVP